MKKLSLFSITILSICLLIFLPGCAGGGALAVEGEERDAVVALAEPLADNMFQAMNARDYAAFSRDFDDEMKKAMTEERFNAMMDTLDSKVGKYQSRTLARVEKAVQYYAVIYSAAFENESSVTWRLVIKLGEPVQVSGLWYNSPKLREN